LASIHDLVTGKQLMRVLLKLLSFCVKVKVNRQQLIKPEMNTVSIMLGALNLVHCYCIVWGLVILHWLSRFNSVQFCPTLCDWGLDSFLRKITC